MPGTPLLSPAHLARIEESFERMNAEWGKLKEFILPGGAPPSAFAHVARTICRRPERRLFALIEIEDEAGALAVPGNGSAAAQIYGLAYLNRPSDLLFVAYRLENRADVLWERDKSPGVAAPAGI